MRIKQSRSTTSTVVGTRTDIMMIRVDLARSTDREISGGLVDSTVIGEPSTGVAGGNAVAEVAANSPKYVGKIWDGGKVAVHPLYPNSS